MRVDAVSRIEWKYTKVTVDSKEAEKLFEFVSNRRDLRRGTVNKLFNVLEAGEHFETPYMTNYIRGKHRLLDGNHRQEAVIKYLARYPDRKVEIGICYYENLTPEEERREYSRWNAAIKQNTNDFIKAYWATLPVKLFEQLRFPIAIGYKWGSKVIELKLLAQAYFGASTPVFSGGQRDSAMEFVEKLQGLTSDDVRMMKSFMNDYIAVFGTPMQQSLYYKPTIFLALFRIWMDNKSNFNPEQIQRRFRKLIGHEKIITLSSKFSHNSVMDARRDLMSVMNGSRIEGRLTVKAEEAEYLQKRDSMIAVPVPVMP